MYCGYAFQLNNSVTEWERQRRKNSCTIKWGTQLNYSLWEQISKATEWVRERERERRFFLNSRMCLLCSGFNGTNGCGYLLLLVLLVSFHFASLSSPFVQEGTSWVYKYQYKWVPRQWSRCFLPPFLSLPIWPLGPSEVQPLSLSHLRLNYPVKPELQNWSEFEERGGLSWVHFDHFFLFTLAWIINHPLAPLT